MPVLGEKSFDSAVQKIMKEQNVSKASAQKIVGSAEKKARLLKLRLAQIGLKKRDVPLEGKGVSTRRATPTTPLRKAVPFGRKPTKAIGRRQQINRMLEENRATVTGEKITPIGATKRSTRGEFKEIISAKQKIDEIKTARKHEHMIEFKRHFRGADQFKRASLEHQQGKYAHYWLLNAKDTNGNGWGVSQQSIAKNIRKFIGKPFVVTAQQWIANSEYGDQFEHPYLRTNNLNTIFEHQEKFRVGNITDIKEKNGEYFAQIEMKSKFAGMRLPPFCSPAIFQLDPSEAEGNISQWEALHLAGLNEDPAYGARIAILRGSCMGTPEQCTIQFRTAKTLCPKGKTLAKQLAAIITKGNTTFNRLSPEDITDVEDIEQNIKGILGTKAKGEVPLVTKKHPRFKQFKERAAGLHGTEGSKTDPELFEKRRKKLKMRISALRSSTNVGVNRVNVLGLRRRKKTPFSLSKKEKKIKRVNIIHHTNLQQRFQDFMETQ